MQRSSRWISQRPPVLILTLALALAVAAGSAACRSNATPAGAPTAATTAPATPPAAPAPVPATAPVPALGGSRVNVDLTEDGFVPSHIPAKQGKPLTLVITRRTDRTCAREIVFAGQEKEGKTPLPLNKTVEVVYTPKLSGVVRFGCAMGMMVGGVLTVE